MKVIGGSFYFALPDDFEGDFADALEVMADYMKAHDPKPVSYVFKTPGDSKLWNQFMEECNLGYKFHGNVTFSKFCNGKWEPVIETKGGNDE